MNMLSLIPSWPWSVGKCKEGSAEIECAEYSIGEVYYESEDEAGDPLGLEDDAAAGAIADLFALAPDHALFAAAMAAGTIQWVPVLAATTDCGEIAFDGLRHSTRLDEFGVPKLTDNLRAALKAALGV